MREEDGNEVYMGSAVVDGQAKLLGPKQSLTQQLLHNNKTPEINIPTLLITVQKTVHRAQQGDKLKANLAIGLL